MGSFCCCCWFFFSSYFFLFVARLQQQKQQHQHKADQFCTVFVFVAVLLFLSLPFLLHPSSSLLLLLDYLLQLRRRQQRQQQQNNQKTVNRLSCFASIEKFADSADRGQRRGQRRNSADFCRFDILVLLCCCCYFCFCSVPVSVVVVAVIVYLHLDIRRLFVVAVVVVVVIALQMLTGLCETSCRGSDATLGLRRLRARRTPCRQAGRGWEIKIC